MPGSKTAWRFLPSHFARYIAMSAWRSSSSAVVSEPKAMPMLARDADPGAVGADREGVGEGVEQAFGDQLRAGRERELLGDDDELVAAEPAERVRLTGRPAQARRDRLQQLVADRCGRACR